ncbi:IS3 family transposase [Streptomyces sp. NPDC049970]|uniref:IS3 family transposase n=1 Tax=Streptomyces sp. NPDC049970 TaxID=3155033 RepID=UPI003431D561
MPGPRAVRDAELTEQITEVHARSRGTYGAPRVHAVLKREGAECGRRRVARLMQAAGLQGRHRGRRHVTTVPDPRAAFRPDLRVSWHIAVSCPSSPRGTTSRPSDVAGETRQLGDLQR